MAKPTQNYSTARNLLLAGVCALSLGGCSTAIDWVGGIFAGSNAYEKMNEPEPNEASRTAHQRMYGDDMEHAGPPTVSTRWDNPTNVPPPASLQRVPASQLQEMDRAAAAGLGGSNADERITALEKAVADLRTDYDEMMPVFKQLLVTNQRMESLLGKIAADKAMPMSSNSATPTSLAPSAGEATVTTLTTPARIPVMPKINSTIQNVRIGEHGSKTRLVLDLSQSTEFSYDLDNIEKLLVIQLPQANWKGNEQKILGSSPLIASWTYQQSPQGGSALAIQLKDEAQVLEADRVDGSGGQPPRIFVDIGRI